MHDKGKWRLLNIYRRIQSVLLDFAWAQPAQKIANVLQLGLTIINTYYRVTSVQLIGAI